MEIFNWRSNSDDLIDCESEDDEDMKDDYDEDYPETELSEINSEEDFQLTLF